MKAPLPGVPSETREQQHKIIGYSCILSTKFPPYLSIQAALEDFEAAQEDEYPGVKTLAMASIALAKFELGQDSQAVSVAKSVLEEAPDYQVSLYHETSFFNSPHGSGERYSRCMDRLSLQIVRYSPV